MATNVLLMQPVTMTPLPMLTHWVQRINESSPSVFRSLLTYFIIWLPSNSSVTGVRQKKGHSASRLGKTVLTWIESNEKCFAGSVHRA